MRAEFVIPGPPKGKGRPRFSQRGGFVRTYTPEQTANYENLVKVEYERQCFGIKFPDGEPLGAKIFAFFKIPESASKKKKQEMLAGKIMPTKPVDCDNIAKIILDPLQDIAYKNDSCIVRLEVEKMYGEEPYTQVLIFTLDEPR